MSVNLGSKKGGNNINSYPQLNHLHHSLQMSIVGTPENNLSYVEAKYYTRKVHTFSVNSS